MLLGVDESGPGSRLIEPLLQQSFGYAWYGFTENAVHAYFDFEKS